MSDPLVHAVRDARCVSLWMTSSVALLPLNSAARVTNFRSAFTVDPRQEWSDGASPIRVKLLIQSWLRGYPRREVGNKGKCDRHGAAASDPTVMASSCGRTSAKHGASLEKREGTLNAEA